MLSKAIVIAVVLCTITHSRCYPEPKTLSIAEDSHANVYSSAGENDDSHQIHENEDRRQLSNLKMVWGDQPYQQNQPNSNEDGNNASDNQQHENVYSSPRRGSSKTEFKWKHEGEIHHQENPRQEMHQHQDKSRQMIRQHEQKQKHNQRQEFRQNQEHYGINKAKSQRVYHGSEEFGGRFVVNQQRSRCHPNCPDLNPDKNDEMIKQWKNKTPQNTSGNYSPELHGK